MMILYLQSIVPDIFVYQLFGFFFYVIFSTLAVFWLDFVLKNYDHCIEGDDSLQCFSVVNESSELVDCSENSNNTNIICYKFVFAFDTAFTSAAGVFTICTTQFTGIVILFIAISKLLRKCENCRCCFILLLHSIQFCVIIGLNILDGFLLTLSVDHFGKPSHELISPLLKISVINGAALIASYVPWWGFKSQDSEDENPLSFKSIPLQKVTS